MLRVLKNKKGFTLIELIVVIVILAILIAALTPAILSVIERANRSADEADTRMVMMIASVAGTGLTPPRQPEFDDFDDEWTDNAGARNVHPGTYRIWFDGPMGVGATVMNARSRQSTQPAGVEVGNPHETDAPGLIIRVLPDGGVQEGP